MAEDQILPARKVKLKWKFVIGTFLFLILSISGVLTYGYFHYGKLIKSFLIETVKRGSKGLYHAEIGDIYLNIIEGDLIVRKFELIPDTALYRKRIGMDTLSPIMFRLKIDHFKIMNFRIYEAISHRRIRISDIRLIAPEITVFRMMVSDQAKGDRSRDQLISIPLPKGWNSVLVSNIELKNGKLEYYDFTGDSVFYQAIPSCSFRITNFLLDSNKITPPRLLNCDDISIRVDSLNLKTKNGLNRLSFGEIGLSTGERLFYVKDFHLIPLFSRHDYTRKMGYQTDRMDIRVDLVKIHRINLRELILSGKFQAGLLEIDSLILDSYRDKRVPRKQGFRPPLPQEELRKLGFYLKIDTVVLQNGKAGYSEQVYNEPGSIYFDKMNAVLTGLTNDSALLKAGLVSELSGSAYLMGNGKLDASLKFDLGNKNNSFTFSARLASFDLREINPMLSKLLPAEISNGKVQRLIIPQVTANNQIARGKLLFYYNDLKIKMQTREESTWNSIKKGVVNFVANDILINTDNPGKSGKMKTGIIYFQRDQEKGIINFLWKSTLSGLKSTMGFNSKKQKEIKKSDRKRN